MLQFLVDAGELSGALSHPMLQVFLGPAQGLLVLPPHRDVPQHADEVPLVSKVAMDKGLRFAIREGGRTVGAGTVTEILE